jgi:hypothetical protein
MWAKIALYTTKIAYSNSKLLVNSHFREVMNMVSM